MSTTPEDPLRAAQTWLEWAEADVPKDRTFETWHERPAVLLRNLVRALAAPPVEVGEAAHDLACGRSPGNRDPLCAECQRQYRMAEIVNRNKPNPKRKRALRSTAPALDVERLARALHREFSSYRQNPSDFKWAARNIASEYAALAPLHPEEETP